MSTRDVAPIIQSQEKETKYNKDAAVSRAAVRSDVYIKPVCWQPWWSERTCRATLQTSRSSWAPYRPHLNQHNNTGKTHETMTVILQGAKQEEGFPTRVMSVLFQLQLMKYFKQTFTHPLSETSRSGSCLFKTLPTFLGLASFWKPATVRGRAVLGADEHIKTPMTS